MNDLPADPAQSPPASAAPVVVPRWIQLVALPLGVVALWIVVSAAGPVTLIFLTAAVIALILNPVVTLLQRRIRIRRGLAILVVYLGFFGLLAAAGVLLANPISDQVSAFRADVPRLVDEANGTLADLQGTFDDAGVEVEIKAQGETALKTLQDKVLGGTGEIVDFGGQILRLLVTAGIGLILVLVVSVYMLLYAPRIGMVARSVFPPGDGSADDDYPTRLQRAVAGYVRGQAAFSIAMGTGAGIALYIYGLLGVFPEGRDYALVFGVFFGTMELIPFVGPILGSIPPILVAFFGDPLTAVWVMLLMGAIQQVEGHVVAPYIFGHTLRINPLFVIFALLAGAETYGILGALVALPLAAMLRETVVYLHRHLVLEPWSVMSPLAAAGVAGECPACGAPATEPPASVSSGP